jgi:hypothetical protein
MYWLQKIVNIFAVCIDGNYKILLCDNVDINRTWGNILENVPISAKDSLGHYELKQHKPWVDK